MSNWDHRPGPQQGMWLTFRDDVEVGSVCFLPEVEHQHVRMDQIVALMAALDAEAAVDEGPLDEWRQLGWQSELQHELCKRRVRAAGRAHRPEVREWLLGEWKRLGFAWPLSTDQMARWEQIVRTARACFEQDRDYMADESWASIPADEFVQYEPGLVTPEVAA